jgi:hypothetical protein
MSKNRLRRIHSNSMEIHGKSKREPKLMKNFSMGAKKENKALTRAPMIYRLYQENCDIFKPQGTWLSVAI